MAHKALFFALVIPRKILYIPVKVARRVQYGNIVQGSGREATIA